MRIFWDVIINGLMASRLVSEKHRWRLYRLVGFDFKKATVAAGAWLSPNRPTIRVGRGTYVNRGIVVLDADRVEIGARCFFGPDVLIASSSHEIGSSTQRAGALVRGAVTIGDGCWIGARTVVLSGSTIGGGSIVAAGSVVTGSLPPNGLYAGVPAVLKRQLDTR